MKFKNNYVNDLIIILVTLFFAMITFMICQLLFVNPDELKDFLNGGIYVVLILSFLTIVILNLINFVVNLFIKPKFYLYDNYFIYKNKQYDYVNIYRMEYFVGYMSKTSRTPCKLIIYDRQMERLCIDNPSIIMMLIIKKRCGRVLFGIRDWKWLLLLFIFMPIVGIAIGLYGKYGGK